MTTFTTDDRIAAQKEAEMELLNKLMHSQYDQVEDIIAHVKHKPLTDEELKPMIDNVNGMVWNLEQFARAIEERHGIK